MRFVISLPSLWIIAGCVFLVGCAEPTSSPPPVADSHDAEAHADHEGHDHEGHDHEGHDHEGHDHEGHDHEGHDHEGHDHASSTTIDADAAGLSVDDLVSVDEAELPDNLGDAVKQLVQLRDTIRDAFEADDAEAAHIPLHEVGHLLGGIEKLVEKSDEDAEHKKEMAGAVEALFDSYTAVDETFHSDGGKQYSEVSSSIDDAVKTLQEHADH